MEESEPMIVQSTKLRAGKSPPVTNRKEFILTALDEYEQPLTRYAQRMLGRAGQLEMARDIVQHTFLKLCQQDLPTIEDRVGPWLFQVCRNRIIDTLRSKGFQTETWPEPLQIADGNPGPAEKVQQQEFLEQLSSWIGQLSGVEREVIELWSQGLNHGEISEILNKSRESIRMGLSRGLKKLRRHPEVNEWLERATSFSKEKTSSSQSSASPAPKRQPYPNPKPR